MKRSFFLPLFASAVLVSAQVPAGTLRAVDAVSSTNVDWTAFMRAQKDVRLGKAVNFVWPGHPAASYAEIRRTLWLAALHGIANQSCDDPRTRQLMEPELKLMRLRLSAPFAYDVAIRDNELAKTVTAPLVAAQVGCLLIGAEEPSPLKVAFCCRPDGIRVDGSEVVLTSPAIATSFAQSSHTDADLIFEADGRVASDVFVRRFKDGTVSVVNLTNALRRDLMYRRGFERRTFDLHPADVIHLLQHDPPRLTVESKQRFISGLWHVAFDGTCPARVVDASGVTTVVPEDYRGTVRYQTTVCLPSGVKTPCLHLDPGESETSVLIGGKSLGVRAWEPFEWTVPAICLGQNVPIEIRIEKRTVKGGLQTLPTWRSR